MRLLQISASFSTAGTLVQETGWATTISDELMQQLVPRASSGGTAGWAYWDEAEQLACSFLGRQLFPDELTIIDSADDLRRLGVQYLKVVFQDEKENTNSVTLINDTP